MIDKNELLKVFHEKCVGECLVCRYFNKEEICELIYNFKEIKIIHCKECQHRNNPLACKLESEGIHMPDDWFCADGIPNDRISRSTITELG